MSVPRLEISVNGARWVARALATDKYRPVLCMAAIGYYDGHAWLVATDTFRMHMLKLGKVKEPFTAKVLNLRWLLHYASFFGLGSFLYINKDLGDIEFAIGSENKTMPPDMWPDDGYTYPSFERVIPKDRRLATEFSVLNPAYLADALAVDFVADARVVVHSSKKSQPVVFSDAMESERWMALVMPMASNGSWIEGLEVEESQ